MVGMMCKAGQSDARAKFVGPWNSASGINKCINILSKALYDHICAEHVYDIAM
jgi:hypothetical protein